MALDLAQMADARWQLLGTAGVVAYVGIRALQAAQDVTLDIGTAAQTTIEIAAFTGIAGSLALAAGFVVSKVYEYVELRRIEAESLSLQGAHLALFEAAEKACTSGAMARFSDPAAGWLVKREGSDSFETMSDRAFRSFERKTAAAGRELTKFEVSAPAPGETPTVVVRRFVGGQLHGPHDSAPAVVTAKDGQAESYLFEAGRRVRAARPDPDQTSFAL